MIRAKKLIEVEQGGFETSPKYLSYGLVLINLSVVTIVIMGAIERKYHILLFLAVVASSITVLLTKRKIEIYEGGIKYGSFL